MFTLKQSDTFSWPVTVLVPLDGGRQGKETFDAEFKRPTQSRIREQVEQITAGALGDEDLARQIVVGWSGVQDGEAERPFSIAALEQLLDVPGVAKALVSAYSDALRGILRKN